MSRPLTEAEARMVADLYPMLCKLVRKFTRDYPRLYEDMLGVGSLALCEAVTSWDPGRGFQFSTYGMIRAKGAMRDARRLAACRQARVRIVALGDWPIPCGGGQHAVEDDDALDWYLRKLPTRHAELLRLIYRDGLSQAVAGNRVGISQPRVSANVDEALRLLRPFANPNRGHVA